MRAAFMSALTDLARADRDVVLVTGDLGFGTFEPFEAEFPKQYFNAGIAEQSMIGIASGLAKAGKKVFVYSIGNFVTLRCLEQIRNDACYHNLNVNLVSQGGGFTYGALGMSHHATEDLAIMRVLPGVSVIAPSNSRNTYEAVVQLAEQPGVSYLRLEKDTACLVKPLPLTVGEPNLVRDGKDILLISTGSILSEAIKASETSNLEVAVLDLHTLKPMNKGSIAEIISRYPIIFSIEEHQKIGGIGSAILELLSEYDINVKLHRIAINDELISIVGDQSYLRSSLGLDCASILKIINEVEK